MEIADEKICSSCAAVLSANDTICIHCGKNLDYEAFQIVPYGMNFGISLKGCVVLGGLNLTQGQQLIAVMNAH